MGPFLFAAFINDVHRALNKSTVYYLQMTQTYFLKKIGSVQIVIIDIILTEIINTTLLCMY